MSVAVVIPVRNGAGDLGRTMEAILTQVRPADELVVVDNGSTDGTAAVAMEAGASVVHEPRPGSYAARNTGVAATTADIVAFTDADCVPDPRWLAELVGALEREPSLDVAGGPIEAQRIETPAERWSAERRVLDQERSWADPTFLPFLATANVAWRRSALERIGGFDAELASGGDVDACWRLQRIGGRLGFAPAAVVRHPHRSSLRTLLAQQHRYAVGHGRLDGRWRHEPGYVAAAGTTRRRARAVWLLPLRLPWRAARGEDLAIPIIDALVRATHEVGRRQGRRRPPLAPLPSIAGTGASGTT